eukprot:NODE_2567_length_1034_cov_79.918412_g2548_i0.p2 GENE.NODE_2567_length_1034_cov_79.918412_g2548_i0~~NODE_2567_length_1034_cov_79.918412_g2548_i0.p2  ORF type:complete len:250 (+),score=52.44 NODE_2567_length_1034_cov_79.918412_g2548_i0:188-937(+)
MVWVCPRQLFWFLEDDRQQVAAIYQVRAGAFWAMAWSGMTTLYKVPEVSTPNWIRSTMHIVRPSRTWIHVFLVWNTYWLVKYWAEEKRQEKTSPGHFRPIPGLIGANAAAAVSVALFRNGLGALWTTMIVANFFTLWFDNADAYGISQNKERLQENAPTKEAWDYFVGKNGTGNGHQKWYNPKDAIIESEFDPVYSYGQWGEFLIRNNYAGLQQQIDYKLSYPPEYWPTLDKLAKEGARPSKEHIGLFR